MEKFDRIKFAPTVMGGKPTIRGMRVTVGAVVGLVASGYSSEDILKLYPWLEKEDITQALRYAAWCSDELGKKEAEIRINAFDEGKISSVTVDEAV